MKDYYKILNVSETSTVDEIKKSYRNMSKKYHPDVNPKGEDKFKEISEAYEILSDGEKRIKYDNQRKNPFADMGGGINFEDLFGTFFNPKQSQRRNAPDKQINVEVGVIDSYKGVDKKITYLRNVKCESCSGEGGEKEICSGCAGQGARTIKTGNGFFSQIIQQQCEVCSGTGKKIKNACHVCSGNGFKTQTDSVQITIPRGVKAGSMFRLANHGDFRYGDYGGLIIKVVLVTQDNFDRVDDDLVYTHYFNLSELNTDKLQIKHPDGELTVTLPNQFDTSIPLRVRGKGFNSERQGDMLINLNVRFNRVEQVVA